MTLPFVRLSRHPLRFPLNFYTWKALELSPSRFLIKFSSRKIDSENADCNWWIGSEQWILNISGNGNFLVLSGNSWEENWRIASSSSIRSLLTWCNSTTTLCVFETNMPNVEQGLCQSKLDRINHLPLHTNDSAIGILRAHPAAADFNCTNGKFAARLSLNCFHALLIPALDNNLPLITKRDVYAFHACWWFPECGLQQLHPWLLKSFASVRSEAWCSLRFMQSFELLMNIRQKFCSRNKKTSSRKASGGDKERLEKFGVRSRVCIRVSGVKLWSVNRFKASFAAAVFTDSSAW